MSRVGRKPVEIPDKVTVDLAGREIRVKGPLGELSTLLPAGVEIKVDGNMATVSAPRRNRHNAGYQGLARALVANMMEGVTKGFERGLNINGVGYKCEPQGQNLTFTLGYSHQIKMTLPAGITAEVDKSQTNIKIKGIDKQLVGQVAAKIRSYKVPEPYKAKGVKYSDETVKRKVGKAGAK